MGAVGNINFGRARGRPRGLMTQRRNQVLAYVIDKAKRREQITLRRLVQDCDLHDNSSALRIIRDLKAMGKVG